MTDTEHNHITYRFTAEIVGDAERLVPHLIPHVIRLERVGSPEPYHPIYDITVDGLDLDVMQEMCRRVEDGHYMLQTIQPKAQFKDFTIE